MPCTLASWWQSFSGDMIEIQVNGLVKSFEVGHNVLDGLTFQIDQGERVGLLGKNGAGKSTLFKIVTGELDYDEGTVTVGQGRRMGLISQIPVYPAGYTVEDVLRTAFSRLQTLAEEMETLAGRMAASCLKNSRPSAATTRMWPSIRWPTACPFPGKCAASSLTASPAVKRPG